MNLTDGHEAKIASKRDERSFWTMVFLAAQNAYNDKAAQFFLIPLAGWLAMSTTGSGDTSLPYVLGGLIVAPFILLSPLAGWLSDRFSKTWILRGSMVLQLIVLAMIVASVVLQNLTIGIFGFFLLAVQSTLLSPAKKGLVKEMVGSERLGFASGVLEMASVLAICAGQIASGFWFDSRLTISGNGWDAARLPLMIIGVAAVPAVLFSWMVKVYPSPGSRPFKVSILWEHFGQLRALFGNRGLKWSGLGVAFFWFFGGFINLLAIKLGEELTGGAEGFGSEMAWFIAAASGGIILGGLLGSIGCKRHIELGLVPIGGLVMVLGCLMMAAVPNASVWLKVWMVVAGAGGALFLVPLNALVQDICPPESRGRVLAGLNLLDCLAGAGAVALQFGLNALGVSFGWQFLILGVLCFVVTCFSTKLLPRHFVRFTVLSFFRIFYRQKVMYAERMPEEGGVLIVPNHVTYLDAFVLTAASPRPIRFLMSDEYFRKAKLVALFAKMFDTVPISPKKAKEAIQIAADAVKEGGVVCIFPEGQLTRSGGMNEMKRGFEMIARKAECPVMPVYMDGLWGSIFSFERGKFIKKLPKKVPYGVTVAWGEVIETRAATAVRMREELHELSGDAFAMREVLRRPGKVFEGKVKLLEGSEARFGELRAGILAQGEKGQRSLLANALQVAEGQVVRRKSVVIVDSRSELAGLFALGVALVKRLRVILVDGGESEEDLLRWVKQYGVTACFGGDDLLERVRGCGVDFYHEGGVLDLSGEVRCYPVGVLEGRVISVSTAHPDAETATNQFQAGWKEGSLGRLLTGYSYVRGDGDLRLSGVVAGDGELVFEGEMDEDGFLFRGLGVVI